MQIRIEATFPQPLKEEPIICNLCKKFDVIMNIIEASFSTDVGWAILVLRGKEEEVNKALSYLKEFRIDINTVESKTA